MQNDMFRPWVNYLVNHNLTFVVYLIMILTFIPSCIWNFFVVLLPEIYNDYKYTLKELSYLKKGS